MWQDGLHVFSENFEQPRGRGEALLNALEHAVKNFGPANRIVVGTGPGSYNGIRAAIAAAEGLKIAWKIPVQGISSILGVPSHAKRYAVVGDARGGCLFFGTVLEEQLEEIRLLPQKEFQDCLNAWEEPVYATAAVPQFPGLIIRTPAVERLAILAAKYSNLADTPSPLYLKPPYITQSVAKIRSRQSIPHKF